jgi:DNA-binding GntR family transcriptional regulator
MQTKYQIKTSAEQAATHLRDMIISGELKQGMKLPETEMAKAMEISRAPIREAFRILEAEGLVQIVSNKGVTVTTITEKDLNEIYELRILLEVYALRNAWEQNADEVLLCMRNVLKRMDEKIETQDFVGYLKASHEMHEVFLKKCGNERVFKLYRVLRNNILAIHIFAYSHPEHSADSMEEHRRIVEALQNKDIESAENKLKFHLSSSLQRAKKILMNRFRL